MKLDMKLWFLFSDSGCIQDLFQQENIANWDTQSCPPYNHGLFRCGSIQSRLLFGSSENIPLYEFSSREDIAYTDFFEQYSTKDNDVAEGENGNGNVGTPHEDATHQDVKTATEMKACLEDTLSDQQSRSSEKESFQDQNTVELDCISREEYISKDEEDSDNNQTKYPQNVNISVLAEDRNGVDTAEDITASALLREGNESAFQEVATSSDVAAKEISVASTFKNENVPAAAQMEYSFHTTEIEKALDTAECSNAQMENANTTLKDYQDDMQYNADKRGNDHTTSMEEADISTAKTAVYPPNTDPNTPENSQASSDTETMLKVKTFHGIVRESPPDTANTRDQIQLKDVCFTKESKLTKTPIKNTYSGFTSVLDKETQNIQDIYNAEADIPKQTAGRLEDFVCFGASRSEMLDNEGPKTGIYIPCSIDNIHSSENCKKGTRKKECNYDDGTTNKKDTRVDSLNTELNDFDEAMMNNFPDGEVETLEGSFIDDDTRILSMVIKAKKSDQPIPNQQDKTEYAVSDVDRSKICNGNRRDVAATKTLEQWKTLCKFLSVYIILTRNGAKAAQIDQLLHDNIDLNQTLQAFVNIFGDYAPAMAYVVGLYQLARRQGRPICRMLRNLFENHGNLPPAGLFVRVYDAHAIQPGGLGVVARALPPQVDAIQILQPGRRANRAVRAYTPRDPVGDTRFLRVLEPRVQGILPIQVTEETNQAFGPSETVPSAHGR
ncbi:uncharacterized protein LOC117331204 [Pecten maximus]|uniref:uncharacterized protein LOC117331204 n=1 Tax=Pecten maximus TaxID=6579 RepID=UPI001458BB09|nr:uncharacterized protein LOC117331204 [Pecten maximus]